MSGPDKTHYLADEEFFGRCRKSPVLINTSRGEVVDGNALKRALRSGTVSAAVLDVWEGEPAIDRELMALVDFATPHIAGYSVDGKANATGMSVHALSRFFQLGMDDWEPLNLPAPPVEKIVIDGTSPALQEVLLEVSRQAYDVRRDDSALRGDPAAFEKLRAEYPVRREPPAISVKLINDRKGAGPVLEELGFKVLSDYCM
jgi:erythronate-4-phosphate dehydrogenase